MNSSIVLLIGIMCILAYFASGSPIWIGLSIGSVAMILLDGLSTTFVSLTLLSSVDTFTLLACPFFVLAGNIMASGGLSPYLFNVVNSFLGRIRGGIAFSTILVCVIYGAITGSTTATLVGASTICLPNMLEAGYSRKFCAGLMSVSATLGQIIPPSVYMIIYGSLVGENTGKLFLSGIIPGLICAASLGVVAYLKSPKIEDMTINTDPAYYSWRNRGKVILKGFPALLMPIIVLGGIYAGVVTPTEAAAVACVYGLVVCVLVYRSISISSLKAAVKGAVVNTSVLYMLVATSYLVALPLTTMQIPQTVTRFVANSGLHGTSLIFAATAVFLVLGCFLDCMPILILVVPIIYPALQAGGVNLIHFNIVTIISMQIAQVTPPFGLSLYMTSRTADCPITDIIKEVWPYIIALCVVLVIIIFFPQISLLLPNIMK